MKKILLEIYEIKLKNIISYLVYFPGYSKMRIFTLINAVRLQFLSWRNKDLVVQSICPKTGDNPFEMIQLYLCLILSEKNKLRYSNSRTVIYSITYYMAELAQILEKDGKLDSGVDKILENLKMPDYKEYHCKTIIKAARYLVGM